MFVPDPLPPLTKAAASCKLDFDDGIDCGDGPPAVATAFDTEIIAA